VSGEATTRRKRLPRAVREQQMMDAAVTVFARQGFHAASMDEVAERAGISKPMLYLYLGSKEELFLACIKREADRVRTAIVSALDDEHGADLPPDRALWYGLSAFFAVVARHRDAWRVLHQQAPAHGEPFAGEVAALRSAIVEFVTVLIERAVAERHPRGRRRPTTDDLGALAHSLIGACEALADWSVTRPDEDPEVTSARLMNFAWLGLDNLLRGTHWPRPR
jgi:AcrR family transcriptional regulator